jgi:energy-coupling factor transport system ATP-binding protein
MKQADQVVWLPGDGSAISGSAAEVLLTCDVRPPLAQLARVLNWPAVPLSVRDARRWLNGDRPGIGVDARQPRPRGEVQVRTRGLSVHYGPIQAVREVDLELYAGQVTALMGRNGAGKSSLLWALQGGQASSGELSVLGSDPRRLGPGEARRLITLVPQTPADLLYLPTVAQELAQADLDAQAAPGTAAALLDRLQAGVDRSADPRDLSEGQRLALVLAIQLAAHPRVVLLDEPTRGLDYQVKHELAGMLGELSDEGLAVLVSTHDVEFVAQAADRTIIMADAEIIADGPTREVVTSSLAYAPQVARVFAPLPVLTLADLASPPAPTSLAACPLARLGGEHR